MVTFLAYFKLAEVERGSGTFDISFKFHSCFVFLLWWGFSGDLANNEKTRQNAKNEQNFDLTGKIEIEGKKLVKTLKINKLLI